MVGDRDANQTEGIENPSQVINRKAFACFKTFRFIRRVGSGWKLSTASPGALTPSKQYGSAWDSTLERYPSYTRVEGAGRLPGLCERKLKNIWPQKFHIQPVG